MRTTLIAVVGLVLALSTAFAHANDAAPARSINASPIGKRIDAFAAQDFRGKDVSLADFADKDVVVVAFLGVECPLAKLYAPRLADLANRFADKSVAIVGVDSNRQDSVTEIAHYARIHGVNFPIIKDAGNAIADQLGAIRTPEVFVLDKQRAVRYWGRIDDQYGFQQAGIAYQRPAPERQDLAIAVEELLAGKDVSVAVAENQGCHIGRIKQPVANSDVTYAKHVAPILFANCVSCHRPGEIGPFSLTDYDETVGWAEMIREVVSEQRMPPWHADPKFGHFKNDARLSDEDKETICRWVKNGAPQGDPADMPALPEFPEGWLIPQPDEVVYMGDEPYMVPAEGTVEYQRFVVDPGWDEDRWVKAVECKPGNPAVVHHIIVYLVPPGTAPEGRAGRLQTNWLAAYAPGLRPQTLDPGMARYVQKGTKLLFEMHYTPNGSAQPDRSYAGFVFADPQTVKQEVAVQNAGNFTFRIPPHDPHHEVEAEYVFRHNTTLLSVSPHMHLRGKDFRYDLVYPDGRIETILWVPHYDFGWQTTYMLTDPLHLPRGTKLHCVAHFDNSADNLANPDPTREVAWGEQTWEEMMFGWFEMALTDQDLTKPASEAATRAKEFVAAAEAGVVGLDDQIRQLAAQAMNDDKAFELVFWQLIDVAPQIDRMCVTYVDGDLLKLRNIQERHGMQTAFRSASTRVKAEGEGLAAAAVGNESVGYAELSKAPGATMNRMARRGVQSSYHVPIQVGGLRCTLNFWSTEPMAFPPQAAALLDELARVVESGAQASAAR